MKILIYLSQENGPKHVSISEIEIECGYYKLTQGVEISEEIFEELNELQRIYNESLEKYWNRLAEVRTKYWKSL